MPLFAVATLTPALLIALGIVLGGLWPWAAVLWMSALTAGLDALVTRVTPPREGVEFPAADALSVALALLHFALLPLAVLAVSGAVGLTPAARLGTGFAAGLWFGQVSHPNAHELIHRARRPLFLLGKWVYISLLFGHHTSAHRLVHHRDVGTPADPNTPRRGEGFYRFALRAWAGSFARGWQAEAARRQGLRNPYLAYMLGALACLALAALLAGPVGIAAYLALAGYAQMQILLSDYVQHYGLSRRDGRVETAAWNAPHWFSSALMLNAPRHSDHHAHPARPYPSLRLNASGPEPTLPYPLPAMAVLALFPHLYRPLMARRLARLPAAAPQANEQAGAAPTALP